MATFWHSVRKTPSHAHPAEMAPRCPGCGYNLFGLVSGRCPECGRSTADAKTVDQLRRTIERNRLRRRLQRRDALFNMAAKSPYISGILFLMAAVGWAVYRSMKATFPFYSEPVSFCYELDDGLTPFRKLGWMVIIFIAITLTIYYLVHRHYTRESHPLVYWIAGSVWMVLGLLMFPY